MKQGKISNDVIRARIEADEAILAFRETQVPYMNQYDIYKHNRRKAEMLAEKEQLEESIKKEKEKVRKNTQEQASATKKKKESKKK